MDYKDILIRALKTGGQAAITALIACVSNLGNITDGDTAKAALITAFIAVVSAFVSAAWNVIVQAVTHDKEK